MRCDDATFRDEVGRRVSCSVHNSQCVFLDVPVRMCQAQHTVSKVVPIHIPRATSGQLTLETSAYQLGENPSKTIR